MYTYTIARLHRAVRSSSPLAAEVVVPRRRVAEKERERERKRENRLYKIIYKIRIENLSLRARASVCAERRSASAAPRSRASSAHMLSAAGWCSRAFSPGSPRWPTWMSTIIITARHSPAATSPLGERAVRGAPRTGFVSLHKLVSYEFI